MSMIWQLRTKCETFFDEISVFSTVDEPMESLSEPVCDMKLTNELTSDLQKQATD